MADKCLLVTGVRGWLCSLNVWKCSFLWCTMYCNYIWWNYFFSFCSIYDKLRFWRKQFSCNYLRSLRNATYREFYCFFRARLGREVRRRIPACVIKIIQEKYPIENDQYTGFKDGEKVSEIDFSWAGDIWTGKNSEPSETFIAKLVNRFKLLTTFTRYTLYILEVSWCFEIDLYCLTIYFIFHKYY